jgi:hypothetical protein
MAAASLCEAVVVYGDEIWLNQAQQLCLQLLPHLWYEHLVGLDCFCR